MCFEWVDMECLWFDDLIRKERRKQEEKEKKEISKKFQEEQETEERRKELIQEAEAKKNRLDKLEEALANKEGDVDSQITVAQRLLSDATDSLTKAVENNDMIGVKVATNMVTVAKENLESLNSQRSAQMKERVKIGQKMKHTLDKFVTKIKKS